MSSTCGYTETDIRRMNDLAESCLPLVYHLVAKTSHNPGDTEEMVSAGCLALVKASRLFNPDAGIKFSTYSFIAIQHGLVNCLRSLAVRRKRRTKPLHRNILQRQKQEPFLDDSDLVAISNRLEEKDRWLFEQLLSGRKHNDIAKELDLWPSAINKRASVLREKLKVILEEYLG